MEIKEYAIEVKKSATRLKSVASALEDPWKIDVTEDMDFCFYKESEGIKLWREDARRTNTLLIEKDGKEEKSRWIPDETDISWPYRQFPIKNGEVYDITLEGADGDPIEITSIVFHDISVVTDKDALKAKLDLCYRQTVLWTQAAENKR
ncbi:MAG: hypothetical protein GY862_25930 [Gammaproteobacteria bacterium]|nr:hypothetical protein [Gammaproteobacteria bacterium]